MCNRFNRRIGVFASTLSRSFQTMVIFGVIFLLVNLAFGTSLYVILVTQLESYRGPITVLQTGIISLLGKVSAVDVISASSFGKLNSHHLFCILERCRIHTATV